MMMWVLAAVVLAFGIGAIFGAPFLPARKADVEAIMKLAGVKKGMRVVDLGSGDGRLLKAAARRGASAVGYEINPLLWAWSLVATWRYRRNITIHIGSYWARPLPECDVVVVFLITHHMERLHHKLNRELKRPTTVVSYIYELPTAPEQSTLNAWLYRYPSH